MLMKGDLSMKDRIFRSPGRFTHTPHPLMYSRPFKYKNWTDERLSKAVDAVSRNKFSIRRAALEFDVPKSTLHDRLSGKVAAGGAKWATEVPH